MEVTIEMPVRSVASGVVAIVTLAVTHVGRFILVYRGTRILASFAPRRDGRVVDGVLKTTLLS
ncbi:MAG: hypothetical protein C5B57_08965 [Blastocatellia bacterium]|nr:MAG: hypothetical protein C5B57_08965 [Blastocatellia bacterium]